MSKRNMLLGLAAGKIGDLVFYRDGGEQRTRTRVIPKNPRSIAQQTQRSKIANASALYRLMAAVLADSFPNRPSNQSGFNAFAATAIPTAPYMTKEQAAADCVLPQPVQIAKGTLSDVASDVAMLTGDKSISIIIDLEMTPATTIADVSEAILAADPALQNGDILTFVDLLFVADASGDLDYDLYRAESVVRAFKLDIASTDTIGSIGFGVTGSSLVPSAVNEWDPQGIIASAIVVSRVEGDGRLNVSNTMLRLNSKAQQLYEDYRSAEARSTAAISYLGSNTSILRD